MSMLTDKMIKKLTIEKEMIKPFAENQVSGGVISYGVSSYGYDFRISDEFQVPNACQLTDPKNANKDAFRSVKSESITMAPNSFVLGRTVEYFKIPRNVITICTGKSTYARSGVMLNVTPFEPEWEGFATICIINVSPSPVKIYANEGIGQLVFLTADEECETSYKDKKGKYQAQKNITHSKI
ncbi:MAG: dCTP deaminase [Candidatus Firestonebacteria bacterium]